MIETYSDGSGSNPQGVGAASFIIVTNQSIIHQDTVVLRNVTNNIAEYTAVEMAIKWVHDNGYDYATCYSDSQLVVRQLNNQYVVKNRSLGVVHTRVLNYIREHGLGIAIVHVPRTHQWIATADNLNRQAVAEVVK